MTATRAPFYIGKYPIKKMERSVTFTHGNCPEIRDLTDHTTMHGRWYTTPEGNRYPSITTILGSEEKTWLNAWKASMGKTRADAETKRCADRGTDLHAMVEKYLNNDPDPTAGVPYSTVGMFNQIKLQLKNRVGIISALEIPLYSDSLKVAGRVDCVAEYDGVLSIIDFKTSSNIKTEDMVQDYFLQCTAYAAMYYEMYGVPIDQIVVIIAVEKGILPMVYKRELFDYLAPLNKRIRTFYQTREKK